MVVFGGDFRQVLPVVPKGNQAATVGASLRSSYLWGNMRKHTLTTNKRVSNMLRDANNRAEAATLQAFADTLLEIGEGRYPRITASPEGYDIVKVPDDMLLPGRDVAELITDIYEEVLDGRGGRTNNLIDRAILTPLNADADAINKRILELLPGQSVEYLSADRVARDDDVMECPPEFLNTMAPSGFPPHKLTLKEGTVVILLRNINPRGGLANGTRLVITRLQERVIQCCILTGSHSGTEVMLPRISLEVSQSDTACFPFVRRQFPIKLAYAMTINKAQGQTFSRVGIYLPRPVFSHGQLYVAMSRVGTPGGVRIMLAHDPLPGTPDGPPGSQAYYTLNVVYKQIFRHMLADPAPSVAANRSSTAPPRTAATSTALSRTASITTSTSTTTSTTATFRLTNSTTAPASSRGHMRFHRTHSWLYMGLIRDSLHLPPYYNRDEVRQAFGPELWDQCVLAYRQAYMDNGVLAANLPWKHGFGVYLEDDDQEAIMVPIDIYGYDFDFASNAPPGALHAGYYVVNRLYSTILDFGQANRVNPW